MSTVGGLKDQFETPYFDSVLGDIDHVVAGMAVAKGIANRITYHKTYPVILKIIFGMGMSGEHGGDPVLLEKGNIFITLLYGEVGIVVGLVDAAAEYRAMEEYEYMPAPAGCGEAGFQPFHLYGLLFRSIFHDAVGIQANESALLVDERESFVSVPGNITVADLRCPGLVVIMVPRNKPDGSDDPSHPFIEQGILEGIRGVVHQVPGDEHQIRLLFIDTGCSSPEKGIRMGITFGSINESGLRVGKMRKLERLERIAGAAGHRRQYEDNSDDRSHNKLKIPLFSDKHKKGRRLKHRPYHYQE